MGGICGCGCQEVVVVITYSVVSACCCKEVHVYWFLHITYPYFTCISSFCSSIPTSFKCFLFFILSRVLYLFTMFITVNNFNLITFTIDAFL